MDEMYLLVGTQGLIFLVLILQSWSMRSLHIKVSNLELPEVKVDDDNTTGNVIVDEWNNRA